MELTSLELNNTIVRLRKVIGQAKFRVTGRLIRRIKLLKKKSLKTDPEAKEDRKKKSGKKLDRYLEDVQALKRLKPDDVSKFALLNTKTLQELKITGKTPASDRVLYKVATNEIVVSAIEEFREKYPEWHREVPFMLQRLGLQYKFRKGERQASDIKKLLTEVKSQDGDGDVEDSSKPDAESTNGEKTENPEKPKKSLLEKVKSRRKEEKLATKKRRQETLKKFPKPSTLGGADGKRKKIMARQLRSKPTPKATSISPPEEAKPISIPEGRMGQMEIRRLRLDSDNSGTDGKTGAQFPSPSSSPFDSGDDEISAKDPFFLDTESLRPESKTLRHVASDFVEETKARRSKESIQKKRIDERDGHEREHFMKNRSAAIGDGKTKNIVAEKRKGRQEDQGASSGKQESTSKESLHPSWEAKRKQKLLHQSLSTTVGKKIKFD